MRREGGKRGVGLEHISLKDRNDIRSYSSKRGLLNRRDELQGS